MAHEPVHPYRGSTNGKRLAPRATVKHAAKKLRRADDRRLARYTA